MVKPLLIIGGCSFLIIAGSVSSRASAQTDDRAVCSAVLAIGLQEMFEEVRDSSVSQATQNLLCSESFRSRAASGSGAATVPVPEVPGLMIGARGALRWSRTESDAFCGQQASRLDAEQYERISRTMLSNWTPEVVAAWRDCIQIVSRPAGPRLRVSNFDGCVFTLEVGWDSPLPGRRNVLAPNILDWSPGIGVTCDGRAPRVRGRLSNSILTCTRHGDARVDIRLNTSDGPAPTVVLPARQPLPAQPRPNECDADAWDGSNCYRCTFSPGPRGIGPRGESVSLTCPSMPAGHAVTVSVNAPGNPAHCPNGGGWRDGTIALSATPPISATTGGSVQLNLPESGTTFRLEGVAASLASRRSITATLTSNSTRAHCDGTVLPLAARGVDLQAGWTMTFESAVPRATAAAPQPRCPAALPQPPRPPTRVRRPPRRQQGQL